MVTADSSGTDRPRVVSVPPGRWKVDALIALAILLLTGPMIQTWTAQPASRYTLTVAAIDDGSLSIDPYVGLLGVDRAEFDGHTYSDKAPYQPLLAAPPYLLFRAAGGAPFPRVDGTVSIHEGTNRGLWWVTLWSSTLPAIGLTILVRRMLLGVAPAHATAIAVALTLGTTVLPFTSWLFGHVMAAMWVALAWSRLRPADSSRRDHLIAGMAIGAGIGTEYTVALVALVLLVDVARQRRWQAAGLLSVGTVVATLPLLLYNWAVFRDPLEISYQGHLPNFQGTGAFGVFNLTLPRPEEITRALVSDRGLFVLTPIVLLAVIGCVLAVAQRAELRRDAWLALVLLGGFILVSTGIDGLGGDSPGPRYLIPMFPFLAVPLSIVWRRAPVLCGVAAAIGGGAMWLAAATEPAIGSTSTNAVGIWLDLLRAGDLTDNVLTGHDHRWLIVVSALSGLLAVVAALRVDPTRSEMQLSPTPGAVDPVVNRAGDGVGQP